jgi:hypothetical protein
MNRRAALSVDQVLERVRGSKEPTPADAARNFAALEARLTLAGPTTRAGTAGARRWPFLVRAGKLAAFGLATGVVGYWIGRADAPLHTVGSPTESPVATAPVAAPRSVESAEGTALEQPPPAPEPPAPEVEQALPNRALARRARRALAHPSNPPVAQKPERGLELSEALELLRRAESAVRHSDGLQARMWLDDLDRRAPRDLLREERLAASVLASCVLGEVAAAREALAELEQVNQQSMYRSRLEGSCAIRAPTP